MTNILPFRTGALPSVTLISVILLFSGFTSPVKGSYNFIRCGECDEARCPELHYCEGQAIKDHCGCCTVCSSSKFQPHIMIEQQAEGNACDEVKCPKLKVCVVNMQGLPLCTCPNPFVCRGIRKREVCGTDGQTYASRCHMRIASCDEGAPVRKKHNGPCNDKSLDSVGTSDRKKVKQTKKRKRRRKDENEGETEGNQQKKKKKEKKRKRRKSGKNRGKSRARRHRGKKQGGTTFEETFSDYTWNA